MCTVRDVLMVGPLERSAKLMSKASALYDKLREAPLCT
jgi:hypothetical protein